MTSHLQAHYGLSLLELLLCELSWVSICYLRSDSGACVSVLTGNWTNSVQCEEDLMQDRVSKLLLLGGFIADWNLIGAPVNREYLAGIMVSSIEYHLKISWIDDIGILGDHMIHFQDWLLDRFDIILWQIICCLIFSVSIQIFGKKSRKLMGCEIKNYKIAWTQFSQ